MARVRNLPSVLAWALAVVIAYLERRDPARPRPTGTSSGAAVPAAPAPAATDQPPPPETEAAAPAVGPARVSAPDETEADVTPATRGEEPASGRPTAAAPDPLVDTTAGETIVGPDAPIRPPSTGTPAVPTGAVPGDGTTACPPDHPIKGNASSMIYHRPGQPSYDRTVAEFCFASEQEAEAAGYRAPKR